MAYVPKAEGEVLLIGLGAQKAASTWLWEQLAAHPDVHLQLPKEHHYWDVVRTPFNWAFSVIAEVRRARTERARGIFRLREFWSAEARAERARLVAYEGLFTGDVNDHGRYLAYLSFSREGQRVVGDITPEYALLTRETYAEILAVHPDVRFVYILRDPVDRLWSGVRFRLRHLVERGVMAREGLLEAFKRALEGPEQLDNRYSRYDLTIQALEAAVPRERILYLFYETMFEPSEIARVEAFLGLEGIATSDERVNTQERILDLPDGLAARAAASLSECYDFCGRRFGDAVPAAWHMPRLKDTGPAA
ncbi:MAG: sulfotransferase [Pseudomonadota bacterium]